MVTALLHATDNWAFNVDRGNVNAVVFLDLKKAFHTADHSILLSKLESCGVSGSAYKWFESYLFSRNQKCFVNGSLSGSKSPYTSRNYSRPTFNHTAHKRSAKLPRILVPQMYDDDTHLPFASRDPDLIERNLNHDLSNSDWLVANKLTLNKSKPEFMVIGFRQRLKTLDRSPALAIDNSPISQVASTKCLGVHIIKRGIIAGQLMPRSCEITLPGF